MEGHHVRAGRHPVEDHKLRACKFVDRQLAHVLVVGQKRIGVSKHDLLRNLPGVGRFEIEVRSLMHAVEFDNHALGMVLFAKILQKLFAQLFI